MKNVSRFGKADNFRITVNKIRAGNSARYNAEYGEYVTGPKVINAESREAMRNALKEIQNGEYAKKFITEGATNYPSMTAYRRNNAAHPIEVVGAKLRGMMPWIQDNKIIDKEKN